LRAALEKTVEQAPDHMMAQVFLARLDLAEGDREGFQRRRVKLEKDYPDESAVELLKALHSSSVKDYDSAIQVLSAMLAETPKSDIVLELARNQWGSGDKQDAISNLELRSETNQDFRVLMMLAEFYQHEGRHDEALAIYQKVNKGLPKNPMVLNNMAWSLMNNDPERGIEYAQIANKLDPDNPYILDTLAMLFLKVGSNVEALEISEQAALKALNVVEIRLNLAEAFVANDHKSRAKTLLNEVYRQTTDENLRQQIDKQLNML
jgi:Flp pilus assembly protein TadD